MMKSFKTYQLIIFYFFSVSLNSQTIAVLDIAPINYDYNNSLKISNYIRKIVKNDMKVDVMDIGEISRVLNRDNIDNKWCADEWCSKEIGKLINKNKILTSSIEQNGKVLNIYGMIYDVEKDTVLKKYSYLFFEEDNYLLTEIQIMVYYLFDRDLTPDLKIQHEYINLRSEALLGITEKNIKKNATIRSLLFPGLGHRYLNKKLHSNIFVATQSFFISNTLYNYLQYRLTSNFYNDLKNNYNKSDDSAEIQILRKQLNEEYSSLKSYINRRKIFTNLAISFWIFNIYHTRKNSPTTIQILEEIDKKFLGNPSIEEIGRRKIDE